MKAKITNSPVAPFRKLPLSCSDILPLESKRYYLWKNGAKCLWIYSWMHWSALVHRRWGAGKDPMRSKRWVAVRRTVLHPKPSFLQLEARHNMRKRSLAGPTPHKRKGVGWNGNTAGSFTFKTSTMTLSKRHILRVRAPLSLSASAPHETQLAEMLR
jgi:hypothetical protein